MIKSYNFYTIGLMAFMGCQASEKEELPNILWITSEDNSAYFTGCYGNTFATTPNIDQLAKQGFLYTHAYANTPVCAPARNTILTGVYAASNGAENMRSRYPKSDIVKTYPELLREAGYYCTNNFKTDYNCGNIDPQKIWDECTETATYKNRPEGKPFFAVINIAISHESHIFKEKKWIPTDELKHDPDQVILPPYHPDTPEMRHDWAQYYDNIQDMDKEVGALLKELEENGEAENTIVFYYGDHGGVLARSKRFVYETGTQVPFIVRIPEKFKHLFPAKNIGDKVERLVSFVDLAPTLLSIIGQPIPEYMQGDAFLGSRKTPDPQYAFMTRTRMDERYDMCRAVRDSKYRYIRNYMPFRGTMQHVNTLFQASSAQSWEDAFRAGKTNEEQSKFFLPKPLEELYDVENDPWEVNNLADNPSYSEVLARMRNAQTDWIRKIRDVGLVPETEYGVLSGGEPMYDYMRSASCPFDKLLEAAQAATAQGEGDIDAYVSYLQDDNSAIRYWGITGLLIHIENAEKAISAIQEAANDTSGSVATLAAETLYKLGHKKLALSAYLRVLDDIDTKDKNFALNSIDAVHAKSPEITAAIEKHYKEAQGSRDMYSGYFTRIAEYLLNKWEKE